MSHAAYVYDIEHVIVDNLQFMTSYLRYVLTHNAFYFRSFFFFLSLLQAQDEMHSASEKYSVKNAWGLWREEA